MPAGTVTTPAATTVDPDATVTTPSGSTVYAGGTEGVLLDQRARGRQLHEEDVLTVAVAGDGSVYVAGDGTAFSGKSGRQEPSR